MLLFVQGPLLPAKEKTHLLIAVTVYIGDKNYKSTVRLPPQNITSSTVFALSVISTMYAVDERSVE
jgi:hypothetical protein